jgi:hypothetical protein
MKRLFIALCLIAAPIRALDYQVVLETQIDGAGDFIHIDPVISVGVQLEGFVFSDGPGHRILLYSIDGSPSRLVDLDRWPTYSINYRDSTDTLHVYAVHQNPAWEPEPELVWLRITEDTVIQVSEALELNLSPYPYGVWESSLLSQRMYFEYSSPREISGLVIEACWRWRAYEFMMGESAGNCTSAWRYSLDLQDGLTFDGTSGFLQADLTFDFGRERVRIKNYYYYFNDLEPDGYSTYSAGSILSVTTETGDPIIFKDSDHGGAGAIFADDFVSSLPRPELIYHGNSEDLLGLRPGNARHIACYHFGADGVQEVWYTPVPYNLKFSHIWKDGSVVAAFQSDNRTVRLVDYTTGEFIDSVTLNRSLDVHTFFETGASPSMLSLVGRSYDTIIVYQFGMPTDAPGPVESPVVPRKFVLNQNHPNPFNNCTVFEYSIPTAGPVMLKLYNLLGQEVVTLVNDYQAQGVYRVSWNGTDNRGVPVASGVYFAKMSFHEANQTVKMVLQR